MSHRRHFRDVLYTFLVDNNSISNVNTSRLSRCQAMNRLAFTLIRIHVTHLNKKCNAYKIRQLRTGTVYQLTNLWSTGILNMLLKSVPSDYYRYDMVKSAQSCWQNTQSFNNELSIILNNVQCKQQQQNPNHHSSSQLLFNVCPLVAHLADMHAALQQSPQTVVT